MYQLKKGCHFRNSHEEKIVSWRSLPSGHSAESNNWLSSAVEVSCLVSLMTFGLKSVSLFWSSLEDVSVSNRRVKSWPTFKKILNYKQCSQIEFLWKHVIPFVSMNHGNVERISTLEPGSLISSWRCWKVSLIFWNIREFSVVWLSKEMASLQELPSSCPSKLVAFWHFGPPGETSWGLSSGKDPRLIFLWTVFICQAMYPVLLAAS